LNNRWAGFERLNTERLFASRAGSPRIESESACCQCTDRPRDSHVVSGKLDSISDLNCLPIRDEMVTNCRAGKRVSRRQLIRKSHIQATNAAGGQHSHFGHCEITDKLRRHKLFARKDFRRR
jgi:hypothetical protein